jgi:hypothetical protein
MSFQKYFKGNAARSNVYCLGVHGLLVIILLSSGCKKKSAPSPAPEVQIIRLAPTNVPIFEEWVGTLDGYGRIVLDGKKTRKRRKRTQIIPTASVPVPAPTLPPPIYRTDSFQRPSRGPRIANVRMFKDKVVSNPPS